MIKKRKKRNKLEKINNNNDNIGKYKYLIGFAAFMILFISAYFSIRGISQLFSGQRYITGILAGTLELAKIACTTYLVKYWLTVNKLIRIYFFIAIIILIIISSAGIFANLTDAYQITAFKNQAIDTKANSLMMEESSLKERKLNLQTNIESTDKEISLIRESIKRNDTQVQKLYKQMKEDSTANWIGSIWEFKSQNKLYKKEISKLREIKDNSYNEINEIDEKLQNVWANIVDDKISEERNTVGPLKKLSELFKVDMDTVAKYFIFLIIIIFDPLGVLLVVTFTLMQFSDRKNKSINTQDITVNNTGINKDNENNNIISKKVISDKVFNNNNNNGNKVSTIKKKRKKESELYKGKVDITKY